MSNQDSGFVSHNEKRTKGSSHAETDGSGSNKVDNKVSFCWCQLFVNGESIGSATRLKIDSTPVLLLVDDVKELVKLKFSDNLVGISAAQLDIYAANDYYETSTPLKASTVWDTRRHGGDTEERAICVKAPKPATLYNQGMSFFLLHRFMHVL